jgi:GTP1/Obg family GTP-binding protein
MLQDIYNFQCTCSLCSAPPAKKQASDRRRERILAIKELLKVQQTSDDETVELTREFLRLVQQENLVDKLKDYYQDLMRVYYGFGDIDSAIYFADAALQKAEEFGDGEDEFKRAIRSNLLALKGMQRSGKQYGWGQQNRESTNLDNT